jgi:hypothetical protein
VSVDLPEPEGSTTVTPVRQVSEGSIMPQNRVGCRGDTETDTFETDTFETDTFETDTFKRNRVLDGRQGPCVRA